MVRTRFTGSGREREGGFSGTHKQDFVAHVTGGDWRHIANHIDMFPTLPAPLNGANVQSTLENVGTNFLGHVGGTLLRHTADQIDMNLPLALYPAPTIQATLELMANTIGQGFITIGDGYGTGYPRKDLYDAFQWAFAQSRIAGKGGIIVVKAGDYVLRRTVVVPNGFTIWGEPGGSRIVSEVTSGPAFDFAFSLDREDIGTGTISSAVSSRMSRMWNLTIFDNKDGNVSSGGPSSPGSPLILMEEGCELILENVTLVGRFTGSSITASGIQVAPSNGATPYQTPTILRMNQCFIDAVGNGVLFDPFLRPDICELVIDKTRARTYSLYPNQFFVKSGVGKVMLSNNYHLGVTPTGYATPSGFLNLTNPYTFVQDAFISLIGNKGGLDIVDAPATNKDQSRIKFIVDNRVGSGVTYKASDIGNSWGAVTGNPWYVIIGDGTHSMGDITGPYALEIVSSLSSTEQDALNSRTEQIIIANPGQYIVNGPLKVTKLIGNVTATDVGLARKVTVILNSDQQILSSGVYENFVGKAENIQFVGLNTPQRVNSYLTDPQDETIFRNVSFVDCCAYIENNRRSVVENCFFGQTGAFFDFVSLAITTDGTCVVNNCKFEGVGYALSQTSWHGEVYLSNCTFDPQGNGIDSSIKTAVSSTYKIRNIDPLYSQSKYIVVGRFSRNVKVDKVFVNGTNVLVDPGMLGLYSAHIEFTSDDFLSVTNSRFWGPDQIYNSTAPIITCDVSAQESIVFNDNQVVGALPLQISDFSISTGSILGSNISICGNDITHYPSTSNLVATALSLDLAISGGITFNGCDGPDGYDGYGCDGYDGYDGYYSSTYPVSVDFDGQLPFSTVSILNNRILGYYKSGGKAINHIFSSNYTNYGLVQVYAPGWVVNFNSNDVVYVSDDADLPDGKTLQSAVVVQNVGGCLKYCVSHIKDNTISFKNDGYKGHDISLINVKSDVSNIQGNVCLSWFCGNAISSGWKRNFLDITSLRHGSLVMGNSFNSNHRAGISKGVFVGSSGDGYDGYGVLMGNWFELSNSGYVIDGATSKWQNISNYGNFTFP